VRAVSAGHPVEADRSSAEQGSSVGLMITLPGGRTRLACLLRRGRRRSARAGPVPRRQHPEGCRRRGRLHSAWHSLG
jgi:hypothetical protein